MGYYAQGDFYSASRGDFYSGRGDFWSKAKKKIKKTAKNLAPIVPAAASLLPGGSLLGKAASFLPMVTGGASKAVALAGVGGAAASVTDALIDSFTGGGKSSGGKKRRTMNAANIGALRRALRRVDSFRNLAKKSGALPAAKRLPPQRGGACCK